MKRKTPHHMKTTLPTTLKHFLLVILVFCTSAAALAQNNSPITGFVLVNADTGEDLVSLTEGIQLDHCEFASLSLSIRALIDPNRQNEVQSVFLAIDGPEDVAYGRTENVAPYALFGDLNSMFNGEHFLAGEYALKAVPYSEVNAGGEQGERLSININFARDLPVFSPQFELIDATANTVISSLADGAVIDNAITTTTNVSLRAIVNADCYPEIESVFLKLEGPVNYGRTENLEAYALFGDLDGDFIGRDLPAGSYTFSVIPYTEDNAGGERGETVRYNFEIIDQDTTGLTFVPDDALEQFFIDQGLDDALDDYVVTANLQSETQVLVTGVRDFTGLEAMQELTSLECNECSFDTIDLSQNLSLETIAIHLNPDLTELDISNNTALTDVRCSASDLTTINFPIDTRLTNLELWGNPRLMDIDFSNLSFMESLDISDTGIEILNINTASRNITADNLTNLTEITFPPFLYNLSLVNSGLKELNLDTVVLVSSLNCSGSENLELIDIKGAFDDLFRDVNRIDISNCPKLTCIEVLDLNTARRNDQEGNWIKDDTAEYTLYCGTSTTDEIAFKNTLNIIDRETNELLAVVASGDEIDFSLFEDKTICFEIEPNEESDNLIKSAVVTLDGPQKSRDFFNGTGPYKTCDDMCIFSCDYLRLNPGLYTLQGFPYTESSRTGELGIISTITFTVSDDNTTNRMIEAQLYPNPAKDLITIDIPQGTPQNDILIVDIYGKQVKKVAAQTGSNQIDVSTLSPGIYFILTETDLGTSRQKLIVQ